MNSIKAFKTSDGKIFEKEANARKHEKQITKEDEIKLFVRKFYFYGMSFVDVYKMIYENRKELLELLK